MLKYCAVASAQFSTARAALARMPLRSLVAAAPFRRFTDGPEPAAAPAGVSGALPPAVMPLDWDEGSGVHEVDSDTEVVSGAADGPRKPGLPRDYRSKDLYSRQYDLEVLALERTVQRLRDLTESVVKAKSASGLGPAQRLLARWFAPLEAAIDKEQKNVMEGVASQDRFVYGPRLLLLPPDKLAAITMNETLNLCMMHGGSVRFLILAKNIGHVVQAEIGMQKMRSERRREWAKLQTMSHSRSHIMINHARDALDEEEWPQKVHVR